MDLDFPQMKVSVDLKNMTGDFLINNSLNRFTYANMGTTVINVNGKSYPADYMLNKAVQTGNLLRMFSEKIVSKGVIAFFSDRSGNTYYTDITNVYESNSDYRSHAWAIARNGRYLSKDAGPLVNLVANDERRFELRLRAFNDTDLRAKKLIKFVSGIETYDMFDGELRHGNAKVPITGFSISYDDKK